MSPIVSPRILATLLLLVAAALPLGGCVGVVLGAGATAGIAAAEERGIKNATNDKGIQLAINDTILRTDLTLYRKVSTTVVEGRVLLTGVVQTEAQRDELVRLTWSATPKIHEVINEVQVAPSGDFLDYTNDTWITTQLRTRIATDKQIVDINYTIETVNGIVYLMGLAQSDAELVRVTDHARTIRGVRRVVSHVWLKTDPRRRPV